MRRAIAILVLVATLLTPTAALAHAGLQAVEQTAGGTRLVFSSPVEKAFLAVEPGGGERVDPNDPNVVLAPGGSELRWRVLSRDGHVTSGSTVAASADRGRESAGALLLGLSRVLLGVGAILLAGVVAARRLVLVPAAREVGAVIPSGSGPLLRAGAWAMLTGVAVAWIGQGTALGALGDPLLATETRWGNAWLAQVAGAAAAFVATRRSGRGGPAGEGVAALGAVVVLAASAWAGHAGSQIDGGLSVWFELAHALATVTWLGALAALAVALGPILRGGAGDGVRIGGAVVVRFSVVATVSVGVLVVTGVYRALAEIEGPASLLETAYGAVLLAKLAIFVMMLGVAGLNRFVAHPRLERAALGLAPDDRGSIALLRRTVAVELALGVALMGCVAALAGLAPG